MERNTTNDVVTLCIGHAVEFKMLWHDSRRYGVGTNYRMILQINTILLGHVEYVVTNVYTFIKRPIKHETVFYAAENAVIIVVDLFS